MRSPLIEIFLAMLVLANVSLLVSSRLSSLIQLAAIQGFLLGIITLSLHTVDLNVRVVVLACGATMLKGVVFPFLFFRAIRIVKIKRDTEPLVGYAASLIIGALFFGFSSWISSRLPSPVPGTSPLIVSISFFTIFTGCFLILSRSKAISQVIGYLVMENGIYLLGVGFLGQASLIVEFGVLLDVFVAVLVMQITLHHISREFDSLSVKKLSQLKDWQAS